MPRMVRALGGVESTSNLIHMANRIQRARKRFANLAKQDLGRAGQSSKARAR